MNRVRRVFGIALTVGTSFLGGCQSEVGKTLPEPSQQGSLPQPVQAPQPLPPGVVMLQRTAITDPGVIAPATAMTALIPAQWRTSGGVVRTGGPCDEPYAVEWTATSDDGLSTMSVFPTEAWQASNIGASGGCPSGTFSSAQEYLTARAQRLYPDARVLDYRDRQDFAASAIEMVQRNVQRAQQAGISMQGKAEGGELLFAFTQNGVEMRGMMAVTATFYLTSLSNPMGGPPLTTLTGSTVGSFAATAPNGALDLELVEASRRSIVPNAEWLDKLFALKTQLGAMAVEGTRQRAAIIVAGGAAATKANIESFQRASGAIPGGSTSSGELYPGEAAGDRNQRRSIEAIRGVDTYLDPVSNSPVQLDHTFGNAWRVTNQDAYILTKDPNFNPGLYGIVATQMKVIK